jgi:site-specific DNA-methyltransferase (adenine-specific)
MIQLYNGDCLEVMTNIPDKSIDMILCDLPYEITACKWDKMIPLDKLWCHYERIIKDRGNIVLFSKQPFTTLLNNSNIKLFKYELIWCKQQATNPLCAKKRIMPIHENISIFYKNFGTYNPQMIYGKSNYKSFSGEKNIGEVYGNNKSIHRNCNDGSRYPTSVLYYNNVRKSLHPTQKPIDLCEYLIKTYTNEGDLVLDNCMGSGSTGVACKNTNRNFIGIELDEKYFKIAENRITKDC